MKMKKIGYWRISLDGDVTQLADPTIGHVILDATQKDLSISFWIALEIKIAISQKDNRACLEHAYLYELQKHFKTI